MCDKERCNPIERETAMAGIAKHVVILAGAALSTCVGAAPAQADPYRWCANYGNSGDGGTNCYFLTLEQCRAAISGNGGYCAPNYFYDGRPVLTPGDGPRRSRNTIPR
jgi:hypothetical protein